MSVEERVEKLEERVTTDLEARLAKLEDLSAANGGPSSTASVSVFDELAQLRALLSEERAARSVLESKLRSAEADLLKRDCRIIHLLRTIKKHDP
eukprot:ANDGO_06418.mRNA.1 hypothetical protein